MINEKRLTQIEGSLTPKQAVLLWLRQERQGKTAKEYVQSMMSRSHHQAPRPRLGRLVMNAIVIAMRGQDPARIRHASRQAAMQTDFLILLLREANNSILGESRCRGLRLALLLEQLRNAAAWDETQETQWLSELKDLGSELSTVRAACEHIQKQYFEGEYILFKDAGETLDLQTTLTQSLLSVITRAIEGDAAELSTDSALHVNGRALEKAKYIVALAKSQMLLDFNEGAAAHEILRALIG